MSQVRSLVQRLGDAELAQRVRAEAVAALTGSCDEASFAYQSCRYSDGFTYGTDRWRFGLGWVADTLSQAAAGEIVRHGHLQLALIGASSGCLVYPLAVGKTAQLDLQSLRVKPSRLRQFLFGPAQLEHQLVFDFTDSAGPFRNKTDHGRSVAQPPRSGAERDAPATNVPGAGPEDDLEGADEAEAEDAQLGDGDLSGLRPAGREVLLLVYTSNPTNGLLAAAIGEATMAEDGSLTFLWCEQLPMRGDGGTGGLRLVDGPGPSGPDFTTGAVPPLTIGIRTTEQAASGTPGTSGPARGAGGLAGPGPGGGG